MRPAPATILAIDDEQTNLKVLHAYLDSTPYKINYSTSAEEGIKVATEIVPDIILLDVLMPKMSGFEVCLALKNNPQTANIPIIFMTALADSESKTKAFEYGAVDYLTKPFEMCEILMRIKNHLALNRTQQELKLLNETLEQQVAARTEELRKKQELLIQTDKMKSLGTLVAGVAHEINNPNNFIMTNAPLLNRIWTNVIPILDDHYERSGDFALSGRLMYSKIKSKLIPLTDGIVDGSNRIANIVSDLKNFSKKDSGVLTDKVNIVDIIDQATTILHNLLKRSTNNLKIDIEAGRHIIAGNQQRLSQVVINLITNACQALENKSKHLYISVKKSDQKVILKVEDQGCGIDTENLNYVKDPFFTSRRTTGGTGLGLAISDEIIKDHNGQLDIESEKGYGTTITVTLPVLDENQNEEFKSE